MAIPKIYRSDDGNAPVLNGVAGSMANLLKKCLVEGYGEKIAAGWTLEYNNVGSTIISLRNGTVNGTGFFLQVDDSGTTSANFRGYESMSAFDFGLFPFPFSSGLSVLKSYTADTTVRRWALVATDTIFYFFCYPPAPATGGVNSTYGTYSIKGQAEVFIFGDFIKARDQGYNCCIGNGYVRYAGNVGTSATPYGMIRNMSLLGTGSGMYAARSFLGDAPSTNRELGIAYIGPSYTAAETSGLNIFTYGENYVAGNIILGPAVLADLNGYPFIYRGRLPGFYAACHHPDAFFGGYTTYQPFTMITEGTRTFLVVPIIGIYATASCRQVFLIDTGEWL